MLVMVPPPPPPATATVVVTGGDSSSSSISSPSSAESSFRQLDDVFLQTQTRIWLGEVLHTRFDEQHDVSDLLCDGELLCEVSKILWNMLLVKFMELRHVKTHTLMPNDSRKSSGRYMPYSNVDSFLKVCKVFGLDGIDLFSPSDVVEKRNTRKVCICIRSLSKKARSRKLNVPDFDIVTYTIAMPTDIVGCIRKSLELSRGRIMGPVHSSCKDKKTSLRQKSSAACEQMNGSYPEDSDEAKRSSTGPQSYVSDPENSHVDSLELDLEDSAGVHSTVNKCRLSENGMHFDVQDEEVDETEHTQYYSEHLPESVESMCFRYFSKLNGMSSHEYESQTRGQGNDASSHCNFPADDRVEVNRTSQQLTFSSPTAFHTDTNCPVLIDEDSPSSSFMDNESYGSNSTPEISKFEDLSSYPDNSDDVEVSSEISMSSLLSGRVLQFEFDAKCDEDDPRTSKQFRPDFPYYEAENKENGIAGFCKVQDMTKYERPMHCPTDDTEQSQVGLELESSDLSVESPLPYWHERSLYSSICQGVELADNQVGLTQRDSAVDLCVNSTSLIVAANDLELAAKVIDDDKAIMSSKRVDSDPDSKELADIHFPVDCGNNVVDGTSKDSNGTCNGSVIEERCLSSFLLQCTTFEDVGKDGDHTLDADILATQCESSFEKHPQCSDDVDKECHQTPTDEGSKDLPLCHAQHTDEDDSKDCNIDSLGEERSDGKHHKSVAEKQNKRNLMVPLLKTVAKGAALIGLMFLLHLRVKNDREKKDEGGEKSSREEKDEGNEKSSGEEKDEGNEKSSGEKKDEGSEKSNSEKKDEGGKQLTPVPKPTGMQFSSWKGKKGSSEVYPAEKLKLG